jgi:hypothetical protein
LHARRCPETAPGVIQFHQPELDAIAKFAKSGDNGVVIVPPNHDAALLFDGVADAVLKAINAPADRVRVAFEGYWLSPDSSSTRPSAFGSPKRPSLYLSFS